MDYESFQRLSQRVTQFMPHLTEATRLLDAVVRTLGASEALLLRNESGGKALVVKTQGLPGDLAVADLGAVTNWYAGMGRSDRPGYSTEGESLSLCGTSYAAGVVGFGEDHDLLVLCRTKPRQFHESYHAWAIASLLRAFEANTAVARAARAAALAETRGTLLDRCARDFGGLVRESSRWKEVDEIYKPAIRADGQPPRWLYSVEYLGYQARLRWWAHAGDQKEASVEADAPNFAKQADRLLRRDMPIREYQPIFDAFQLDWLKGAGQGSTSRESGKGAVAGPQYENWEEVCLLVLEHGWRIVLKGPPQIPQPVGDANLSPDGSKDSVWPPPVEELAKSVDGLLKLSARLFGARLQLGWPGEVETRQAESAASARAVKTVEPTEGMLLDRTVLWSYLGSLVAQSRSLEETYLTPENAGLAVPVELRRDYMTQLARFFLGLVERLERARRMDVSTRTVSATETLDALLYLVDRYVHVELGVEEWIDLRHHMARSLRSEVAQHFASGRYRDHLLHVIDVFLLGHLLLHTGIRSGGPGESPVLLVEQLSSHQHKCKAGHCECPVPKPGTMCLRNWALAALLHDIGYQLRASRNETPRPESVREYFDLANLDTTSALAPRRKKDKQYVANLIKLLRDGFAGKTWLPSNLKEEDRLDHGVLSALRLGQVLAAVGSREPGHRGRRGRFLAQYCPALHAICHHNLFARRVSLLDHPMSCLLRLCDELQEWGRHRVNIERMTKQLYLAIEGETSIELGGRQLLSRMEVNIRPTLKVGKGGTSDVLTFEVAENQSSCFQFELVYQDPESAEYDATLTLLSKAFNLQHLDLTGPDGDAGCHLRWCIGMEFPQPADYRNLSEYDIYAQFVAEQIRWLPAFLPGSVRPVTGAGLIRLKADRDSSSVPGRRPDGFAIVVDGESSSEKRQGWLVANPEQIVDAFLEFKKRYLLSRLPKSAQPRL